jgi:xylose isomerase
MAAYFGGIPAVEYRGPGSKEAPAFRFYDPDRVVLGKTMREHLPFAMAWWHNLGAAGVDMFGQGTADKSFGAAPGTMAHAHAKVDAGFEFMRKLGIGYFCFHDMDLVPEADTLEETSQRLDEIADHILQKMGETGIRLLWGTANLFSHSRYMNGAGSANQLDVYCHAAAQIKKALDITVRLGGRGYVFWGGREGYETLLNTDMKFEQENIAALMRMAVDYARSIGFAGDFYIEPKPKEPMKHQYDFDAATAIGFLRRYGLDRDFKLNVEANHATLAGHTFQHELRTAAMNGMLGSVDANQGDLLLGWDTDHFPSNVYDTTMAMYEILKNGGLKNGGLNFDAKNRRPSNDAADMFHAFILGMDAFALGLLKAARLIEDRRMDEFVRRRYESFDSALGKKVRAGEATLAELSARAVTAGDAPLPESGRQEYLEGVVNEILFGS